MIDSSNKSPEINLLSYLYLIRNEFWEVNDFINTLKEHKPFSFDVRESTPIQNALNIAVVISYARNFKKNRGFIKIDGINAELIKSFTDAEKELHKKIIDWRDQEYAHSDASQNDIQIYGASSYSRKVVRQLFEKVQLDLLKLMVNKIREQIEAQIRSLSKSNELTNLFQK
jgi:hypothetical protein